MDELQRGTHAVHEDIREHNDINMSNLFTILLATHGEQSDVNLA